MLALTFLSKFIALPQLLQVYFTNISSFYLYNNHLQEIPAGNLDFIFISQYFPILPFITIFMRHCQ